MGTCQSNVNVVYVKCRLTSDCKKKKASLDLIHKKFCIAHSNILILQTVSSLWPLLVNVDSFKHVDSIKIVPQT